MTRKREHWLAGAVLGAGAILAGDDGWNSVRRKRPKCDCAVGVCAEGGAICDAPDCRGLENDAIERAYLEALAARPVAEEPSPEERHLMIETLLQLDSLLVGLSARVRQIFFLSQLDGLTYPQIATQLSLTVAQVQRAMGKAFSVCYASRFE